LALFAAASVASFRAGSGNERGGTTPNGQTGEVALEYTTEAGKGSVEGAVNSPLTIGIRLPKLKGQSQDEPAAAASVQLFDDNGNPAILGDKPGEPCTMRPTSDSGVWLCDWSVPSKPGKYHARVTVE